MANGLILSIDEFQALPRAKQLSCLYENQCRTLTYISGWKYHKKILYTWLSVGTAAIGFMFKFIIGGLV